MTRNILQSIKIDLKSLESKARLAISKEAYQQLDHTNDYRVGISVILSDDGEISNLIELVYCVFKKNAKVNISKLNVVLEISKVLMEKGYLIFHQDDGWIICEKAVKSEEIDNEYEFLKNLMQNFEG